MSTQVAIPEIDKGPTTAITRVTDILEHDTSEEEKVNNYKLLEKLYTSKLHQLDRAVSAGNHLRSLILKAEAEAICQELAQLQPCK